MWRERPVEIFYYLSCPPYVLYGGDSGRFSCRGADVAEKISEVAFLYGCPGRHAQPHTNHKPVFAELADLAKTVFHPISI